MQDWIDLVSEIIVVDSHSTDRTVELIRERLKHSGLRIHFHPRGLYQSWNFGLSQLRTKYAYISTVGDSITRAGLEHLRAVADKLQCDVATSRPRFIDNERKLLPKQIRWPIDDMLSALKITSPTTVEGITLFIFAMLNTPNAVLGSSASNLYRTEVLQRWPFPTDFGTAGDAAWGVTHAFEFSLGVTPEIFSTFRHHPKAYSKSEYAVDDIGWKMFLLASETFEKQIMLDDRLKRQARHICCRNFIGDTRKLREWQRRLLMFRNQRFPWLLNPSAWRARIMRNRLRQAVSREKSAILKFVNTTLNHLP